MRFLLDTHVIAWFAVGDARLREPARSAVEAPNELFVSAVIAYEYADLVERGRLGNAPRFNSIADDLALVVLDYPASAWRMGSKLPLIHKDPIDRMMIAHAMLEDLTIITADEHIRQYPVKTLW